MGLRIQAVRFLPGVGQAGMLACGNSFGSAAPGKQGFTFATHCRMTGRVPANASSERWSAAASRALASAAMVLETLGCCAWAANRPQAVSARLPMNQAASRTNGIARRREEQRVVTASSWHTRAWPPNQSPPVPLRFLPIHGRQGIKGISPATARGRAWFSPARASGPS